jgi:hypothetical protein
MGIRGECKACVSPHRAAIDAALLAHVSRSECERMFHIGRALLGRHMAHIDPVTVARAQVDRQKLAAAMVDDGRPITPTDARTQLSDVIRRIDRLLRAAENRAATGESAEALKIPPIYYRELRETMRLLAEVEGKLPTAGTVNISVGAVWLEVREIIMQATEGHPDIRDRIAAALIARGALPSPQASKVEPQPASEQAQASTREQEGEAGGVPEAHPEPGPAPPPPRSTGPARLPAGGFLSLRGDPAYVSDLSAQGTPSGDPGSGDPGLPLTKAVMEQPSELLERAPWLKRPGDPKSAVEVRL